MSEAKKKCRQYSIEYLKYGFTYSPANQFLPMCLTCQKNFSNEAMKPSRLQEHLNKMHANKELKNKYSGGRWPSGKERRLSRDKVESYRPISLLNSISKIIEKIIHRRLNKYLNQTNKK
jgi:hypothetical protein